MTEADLTDTSISLRDVQAVLLSMFSADTILIGHSLESDLLALKVPRPPAGSAPWGPQRAAGLLWAWCPGPGWEAWAQCPGPFTRQPPGPELLVLSARRSSTAPWWTRPCSSRTAWASPTSAPCGTSWPTTSDRSSRTTVRARAGPGWGLGLRGAGRP